MKVSIGTPMATFFIKLKDGFITAKTGPDGTCEIGGPDITDEIAEVIRSRPLVKLSPEGSGLEAILEVVE